MSRKTRLPPKKDVALALLENSTLFLHLDPRHDDVKVPPWFKRQPQLVLQIGLNMPKPISDLNVDDDGVGCTLSFSQSPHFCFVPWSAIYALVGEDGRGMVWPDDVPPEVAAQVQNQSAEPKPRARLHAVSQPDTVKPPTSLDSKREADRKAAQAPGALEKKKPRRKAQKPRAPAGARRDLSRPARPLLAPVEEPVASRDKDRNSEQSRDGSKKKRELPPYLRVVK